MTEERLVLAELLEKTGESDFLRAVAEAVALRGTIVAGLLLAAAVIFLASLIGGAFR